MGLLELVEMWLTWIGHDNDGRVLKIAVPVVPSPWLVVKIHGYWGMVHEIIWGEARAAPLQNPAIYLWTCIIDVG